MTDLQQRLQEINQLNETKGQELTTLSQIVEFRQQAELASDWPMVAQSYWQEHLVHQHLVMNGQDLDNIHRQSMLSAAKLAHQVVIDHQLNELLGSSHRFLGRANTYNNQHEEAKTQYESSIDCLKKTNDIRYLEVTGFYCESLLRSGQVEAGLNQAYQLFDSYDTNPDATTLKHTDEYTWTVWRTGIFPRLVTTLDELSLDYDKTKMKAYLEKSQALLANQPKFNYRVNEIKNTLTKFFFFLFSTLSIHNHFH